MAVLIVTITELGPDEVPTLRRFLSALSEAQCLSLRLTWATVNLGDPKLDAVELRVSGDGPLVWRAWSAFSTWGYHCRVEGSERWQPPPATPEEMP